MLSFVCCDGKPRTSATTKPSLHGVTTLTRLVVEEEHNSKGSLDSLLGIRRLRESLYGFWTLQEKVGPANVHAIFYRLF